MKLKKKLVRIGWVGYVNDKPCFDVVIDEYGLENEFVGEHLFKHKKDAKRRFEDVRAVFVEEQP